VCVCRALEQNSHRLGWTRQPRSIC